MKSEWNSKVFQSYLEWFISNFFCVFSWLKITHGDESFLGQRRDFCVYIFSDPFPNICCPVIDSRSLIPLTTLCLYRGVCFHLHILRDKLFRQQLTEGQRHRISCPLQIYEIHQGLPETYMCLQASWSEKQFEAREALGWKFVYTCPVLILS